MILSVHLAVGAAYAQSDASFEFRVARTYGYPGDQGVRVPVLLSNSDTVGAWDVLMEYDISGGEVFDFEFCDSAVVDVGDSVATYYAPWYQHPDSQPEYSVFETGAYGQDNYLRLLAIMDLDIPWEPVPPIPPGQEWLVFCLLCDVDPLWDGDPVAFDFVTLDCTNNVISSRTGDTLWGPDTLSAPTSTCPERPDELRVIHLVGAFGIELGEALCGDPNDNGIPWEISDMIVLLQYLDMGAPYTSMASADVDSCLGIIWNDFKVFQLVVGGCLPPPSICPPLTPPQQSLLDTLIVVDAPASPGESVTVDVSVVNSESVSFLSIPLCYDTVDFAVVSVAVDDIFSDWTLTTAEIHDSTGTVMISLLNEAECPAGQVPQLPPGRHHVASLLVVADPVGPNTWTDVDTCRTDRFRLQWDCVIPAVSRTRYEPFIRADANADMNVEMADAVYTLRYLYVPGSVPAPPCMDAADANDDGGIFMSDAIYTLKHLNVPGSPAPPAPFPDCGSDPTPDQYECGDHPCMW